MSPKLQKPLNGIRDRERADEIVPIQAAGVFGPIVWY